MARPAFVIMSLLTAALVLAGCGGSTKVAPTTTTTLAPLTLPVSLSAVESFFDGQGGGGWKPGALSSSDAFMIDGMAQDNDTCPTSRVGPGGATAVSLIAVHCATAGPPNTTFQQAVALIVATVQKFAPAGVSWTETALRSNTSVSRTKTFGNAVVEVGIAPVQETADLSITAKGFP